jgi:hypothetical protein
VKMGYKADQIGSLYRAHIESDVDEEDLALMEENTGVKIQRPEVKCHTEL